MFISFHVIQAIELDSTDGLSYMNRGIVRAILKGIHVVQDN